MLQNTAAAVRLSYVNHTLKVAGSRLRRCATAIKYFAPEVDTVPTGTCPECEADVHVDVDTDKGESVSCEDCGTELEVVGLDPLELDIVEEEDLDDDDDDDPI